MVWGQNKYKLTTKWGYPVLNDSRAEIVSRWGYPMAVDNSSPAVVPSPIVPGYVFSLGNPDFNPTNTDNSNSLGADGYTWASGKPLVIDKYGKFIVLQQVHGISIYFMISNDQGSTWVDLPLSNLFIVRGSMAYDEVNDIIHILWACGATDGILYRRYNIVRDGSSNITNITRDMSINLQLDFQQVPDVFYSFPTLLWLNDAEFGANGALVAAWGIDQYNGAALGCEVRSSMRILSNTVDDNVAGNWKPVSNDSVSTISTDAQVPYTCIANSINTLRVSSSLNRKVSGVHSKDLYYGSGIGLNYRFKRLGFNSATADFSGSSSPDTLLTPVTRAGSDSGCAEKENLISEIRFEPNSDKAVMAFSTWKSDSDKDAWGFIFINNDDSVGNLIDLYVSGVGEPGWFISGDIMCDPVSGYIISTWINRSDMHIFVKVVDSNGNQILPAIEIFSSVPCDTPILYDKRVTVGGVDKLLVNFRDFNSEATSLPPVYTPPYVGYFGTLDIV